jgi:hypothetical protein
MMNKDLIAWTIGFALNLVVCLILAHGLLHLAGWVGAGLACMVMWLMGCYLCTRPGRVRAALAYGSIGFAFTQFVPVAQLLVGAFAIGLSDNVGLGRDAIGGAAYLVTFTTGQPLIVLAFVVSWCINSANGLNDTILAEREREHEHRHEA